MSLYVTPALEPISSNPWRDFEHALEERSMTWFEKVTPHRYRFHPPLYAWRSVPNPAQVLEELDALENLWPLIHHHK